jgi:hypothetical protein
MRRWSEKPEEERRLSDTWIFSIGTSFAKRFGTRPFG